VLIDDLPEKKAAVQRFIEKYYPNDELTWFKNFRQAQNNLLVYTFDLLLLDMSFEVHGAVAEDLAFNGLAGLHVLQFMWASEIEIPTVILTSHENYSDPDFGVLRGIDALRNHAREVFGETVIDVVKLVPDEAIWNAQLKEILENAGI